MELKFRHLRNSIANIYLLKFMGFLGICVMGDVELEKEHEKVFKIVINIGLSFLLISFYIKL